MPPIALSLERYQGLATETGAGGDLPRGQDRLYTVIVETPDGPTVVEQVAAPHLGAAMIQWGIQVRPHLPPRVIAEFTRDGFSPLAGKKNVWFSVVAMEAGLYLMFTVQTSSPRIN